MFLVLMYSTVTSGSQQGSDFSTHKLTKLIGELQHSMMLGSAALRLRALLLILVLFQDTSAELSLMNFNFLLQKEIINDEIVSMGCVIYSL